MTSESKSTPKQKPETTGRKCIECGADSKPPSKSRPSGYNHCSACRSFKHKYGFYLTHEDRAYLDSLPQACGICSATDRTLNIDHCHATNKIRGYLCHECNMGIGKLGDNLESLTNAVNYLQNALLKKEED